ncbi:MAG: hypothetical protein JXA50_06210 [Deltaproteobacteria bacterium]|nr:hypothetical protein [Deltaproteobacteria bacterium]
MKKRKFLLRVVIGVGCIIAFTILVFWRQQVVQTQRDRTIVSTISEWEVHGKPVVVLDIAREDMRVYEKISLTPLSKTLYEGYVTKDFHEQLQAGQRVFADTEQGEKVVGVINYVGQTLNIDTGMFRVRAAFDREVGLNNHIVVAYVHIETLHDIISIPNEVVTEINGEFFVWTVRDGHAYKQNILIGESNDYGAVVLQGLHDGDMVVIQGQTQLVHGDKVRIVDNKEVMRHIP